MFARKGVILVATSLVALTSGLPAQSQTLGNFFGAFPGSFRDPSPYREAHRRYRDPGYGTYRPRYVEPDYEVEIYREPEYRSEVYRDPGYRSQTYRGPKVRGNSNSHAAKGRQSVQRRLNQLGYNAGPVDGVYGDLTRTAMASFQRSLGDRATGHLTSAQVAALYESTKPGRLDYSTQSSVEVIPARADPIVTDTVSTNANDAPAVGPVFTPQGLPVGVEAKKNTTKGDTSGGSDMRTIIAQQTAVAPVPNIDDGFVITLPPGALPLPLPRAQPSANPFGNRKWQPKIFDITAGDGRSDVRKKLTENGYRNCSEDESTMVCSSDNQSMSDKISVAFSVDETEKPAYLIRRALTFKKPVKRAFLERQMAGRYPQLLSDDDGIVSSSESCKDAVGLTPGSAGTDALQTLFNQQKAKADIDAATLDLLEACPDFYALAFDGDETVSHVEIVVFNSATMRTKHLAELRQRKFERSKGGDGQAGKTLKF